MEKCFRYYSPRSSHSSQYRTQQKPFNGLSSQDFTRREQSLRLSRSRLSCYCLHGGNTSIKDDVRVLRHELKEAVDREDYCRAARLRDEILRLEAQDPVLVMKKELKRAVKNEDYEIAALLRDKLRKVDSSPIQSSTKVTTILRPDSCNSDALTRGIRIRVRSFYVEHLSAASQGKYVFAYQVEITNEGDETVQLKHRSWKIIDARGHIEQTSGWGVVGQQPILEPGRYFQYMSVCPLDTPFGTMEGYYDMVVLNRHSQETFYANIGQFGLDVDAHKKIRD
eukprot:g900.t1